MPDYIPDPNDSTKQIPGPKTDQHFDRGGNPTNNTHTKTPHFVILNTVPTMNIGFAFGYTSASLSAAGNGTAENYINYGKPAAGTQLNINPCAWSGSAADNTAQCVTFVYKGGLDGQGRP